MRKYLVTGGAGFIGSKLVQATKADSFDLKSGKDILDTESLTLACSGSQGVFHCAARISVPESFESSDEYHLNNVQGTESIIQATKNNLKIVFSSSAAVYGESNQHVKETDQMRPQSPYAENKRDGESLLLGSGLPVVVLRYFNVYGPGQSAAYAGVVTAFVKAALKSEDLIIYGNGEQARDFVYVDDVVRANIAAMETAVEGEVFNIGSGTKTSIKQLAEEVIRLANSSSGIRYEESRLGDIIYSQADVSKAAKELNWKAEVSLAEGLRQTIDSYRD